MEKENRDVSLDTMMETNHSMTMKGVMMILFIGYSFLVFNVGGYNNFVPSDLVLLVRVIVLCIATLCTFILYMTKGKDNQFWRLSFSFFIVSIGFLCTFFLGKWYSLIPGITTATVEGIAVAKIAEVLPIIIPILIGIWLLERDFTPVYLTGGDFKKTLKLGIVLSPVALIPFFALGGLSLSVGFDVVVGWIPWLCVFAFSNAFMEELMIRGIFLKKYDSLFGQRESLILTSVIFAIFHQALLEYTDIITFSAFLIITFLLGLIWGYIMQKTDSIWGAVLAHAIADILFIIAVFGV